jgi:hypothetical protein
MLDSYCIHSDSLITEGDLNLTTSRDKILVSCSREDVLANFFLNKSELANLVDAKTILLFPTWYNK